MNRFPSSGTALFARVPPARERMSRRVSVEPLPYLRYCPRMGPVGHGMVHLARNRSFGSLPNYRAITRLQVRKGFRRPRAVLSAHRAVGRSDSPRVVVAKRFEAAPAFPPPDRLEASRNRVAEQFSISRLLPRTRLRGPKPSSAGALFLIARLLPRTVCGGVRIVPPSIGHASPQSGRRWMQAWTKFFCPSCAGRSPARSPP